MYAIRSYYGRDLGERLQEAQLQRPGLGGNHSGGIGQLLRGLELPFGVDDLGATLPLGLGLPCHGPLHLGRQVDVLDLDIGDLDPPGVGLPIKNLLQVLVDPFPVRVV